MIISFLRYRPNLSSRKAKTARPEMTPFTRIISSLSSARSRRSHTSSHTARPSGDSGRDRQWGRQHKPSWEIGESVACHRFLGDDCRHAAIHGAGATGREADARTDIFAFGAVLYEMVAGRKAFEGSSQASLISAITSGEPPPPALDQLVKTCLAKDPDKAANYLAHAD